METAEKSITRVMISFFIFIIVSILGYILATGYIIPAFLKASTLEETATLLDIDLILAPIAAYIIAAIAACLFVNLFKKLEPYKKFTVDNDNRINGMMSCLAFGFKVGLILIPIAFIMASITLFLITLGTLPSIAYLCIFINVPFVMLPFSFLIFVGCGLEDELKKLNWNTIKTTITKQIKKMKTKMIISTILAIAIFCVTANYLEGISNIGIDRIPFSDYPWGFGKSWIMFYVIFCPAAVCAAIPFTPIIIKKVFGRSWEQ